MVCRAVVKWNYRIGLVVKVRWEECGVGVHGYGVITSGKHVRNRIAGDFFHS